MGNRSVGTNIVIILLILIIIGIVYLLVKLILHQAKLRKTPEGRAQLRTMQEIASAKSSVRRNAEREINCPRCGSNQLSVDGKKLSLGRAVAGGVLLGGVGAVLGGLTSKKVIITCLSCGHRFKPGQGWNKRLTHRGSTQ